jgi:hypothetical protein
MKPKFHLIAMMVWAALLIPSLLWRRQSVTWIVFMSLYANFVGHFSAWQGSRAEREAHNGA